MRPEANEDAIVRAVVKVILATFDESRWLQFGLETGCLKQVQNEHRLLQGAKWNNEDYPGIVIGIVPRILRAPNAGSSRSRGAGAYSRMPNLSVVEQFLDLSHWLEQNDRELYGALYAGTDTSVIDHAEKAAAQLGIEEVSEHAGRIRRGLRDDPKLALGSAKELLESVFKTILGLHGNGRETLIDLPALVKRTNIALGLDVAGVRDDDPGAKQRRQLLGALNGIVGATAELRNEGFSTGHGGSNRAKLNEATTRLAVTSAIALATFYIEAWDGITHDDDAKKEVRW